MKFTRTLLASAIAGTMVLALSACSQTANQASSAAATAASAASNAAMAAKTTAANTAMAAKNMASSAMSSTHAMASKMTMPAATNWFGGPIYNGAPALAATAALVKAGGGASNFKFSTALVAMLGEKTVNAEVAKLTKQYGKADVDSFIKGMTFAVNDALKRATEAGIKLPPPANLSGAALAGALVDAGTAPDGTFWAGYMFDKTISHKLHNQVMADIDAHASHASDQNTHKILNQAMYDVAQALGKKNVKLASLH